MAHEFDHPEFDSTENDSSVAVLEYNPNLDLWAWQKRGEELTKKDSDVRWELGEWILSGTEMFEDKPHDPVETLDHAEIITGLARGTLKDLASTAHRFPASVRTDALSWSHHRVLINMRPDDDEDKLKEWLDLAVEKKLPVAAFVKELKSPVGPKPSLTKTILVTVPLNVWETLNELVDEDDDTITTIQEYAAKVLVDHCQEDGISSRREMLKKRSKERRRAHGRRVVRRNPHVLNNLRH
ncbi:MAG: hypothetical protein WA639_23240 [Candidatus Acidiferrum sp.]